MTPNQASQAVFRGQGPPGIDRIDGPHLSGEQWHAHLGPGQGSVAVKQDGTWRHLPAGKLPPVLTKKTAAISARCGMERMKNLAELEAHFWKMLEKSRLVDLSQYHQPDFYEEVPLYSRYADIAYLKQCSTAEASAILLRFSLRFLSAVISYEEHESDFFAAITASHTSLDEPIVPRIFVWSRPIAELYEKLKLKEPATPFGKSMKRVLSDLRLLTRHELLEETQALEEGSRVFVSPALPPYRGFVPIYLFAQPASKKSGQPTPRRHGRTVRT